MKFQVKKNIQRRDSEREKAERFRKELMIFRREWNTEGKVLSVLNTLVEGEGFNEEVLIVHT